MIQHFELQKQEDDTLCLIDEQGQKHSLKYLMTLCPQARVYAFEAKMGAGKTTLISQLCRELGTADVANSPTFAIVNVYEVGAEEMYHFDCYRLKNLQEALDLGAEEYLYSGSYCFIEWPKVLSPILPEDTINISIDVNHDGTRKLTIHDYID